jgi:hypothetical protein
MLGGISFHPAEPVAVRFTPDGANVTQRSNLCPSVSVYETEYGILIPPPSERRSEEEP